MNPVGDEHAESGEHSSHGEGGHHQNGPTVVLFVVLGLLFGAFLREINKKTKIPYTPMLLVTGIFFGYCRESLGTFGDSVSLISNMSPHMILLVFIPVLLFESAFNCDWHVFSKSLGNILLLAGPGVLWGAIIIAFIFKVVLGYTDDDLTWYEACTLGCVLSATDPVAVVALLKELGASIQFNLLVEGESLLNDGTAMVFFMLFLGLVKGESATVLGVVTNFVRMSIGGPLLGIGIGFLLCFWLKKILRDTVLTVSITIIGTYLCFYLAEFTFLHVSGILSIVSLGLYFSAVGKRKIYPESEHAMHHVWSVIQFSSQTLIFMLTGIIVGIRMIEQTTITSSDWLKMFLFYILMILARTVMVLTLYPLLTKFGYGLTRKELVVLIYGGLRGALGLCLSLLVGVDSSLRLRFREITVFYMCGMACLTIVLNGLTCGKVVNFVEMIRVPPIKGKLLKRALRAVLEATQLKLKEIKGDSAFSYAKWRSVEKEANIKQIGGTFHERMSRVNVVSHHNPMEIELRQSLKEINREDIKEEVRFRFTSILSRIIWHHYEEGQLSEEGVALLSSTCSITIDDPRLKLNYFDVLSGFFGLESVEWYLGFKNSPFVGNYCVREAVSKIYNAFETTTVFIEACEMVKPKLLKEYPFIEEEHVRMVLDEVDENIELAQIFISELEGTYPKIIQSVHTERATTVVLKNKKNALKHLYDEGCVDEIDYTALRREVDKKLLSIRGSYVTLEDIRFNEVFAHSPLFSMLSQLELTEIRARSKLRQQKKGATLIRSGSRVKSAIVLVSGSAKETFKEEDNREGFHLIRSVGCVLNPYDFIYKEESKCEVKARNAVRFYQIEEAAIADLMNNNLEFKKVWFKSLFIYCHHLHEGLRLIQQDVSDRDIRKLVESADVVQIGKNQTFDVPVGVFIFQGQIEHESQIYVKGDFITSPSTIKSLDKATLLLSFVPRGRGISLMQERFSN